MNLPLKISSTIQLNRIFLDVFGVICFFCLANLLSAWYLSEYTTNSGYWMIRHKLELLNSSAPPPVDWLVLGDSSCRLGVVPEVIQRDLGGKALNLCTTASMTLVGDYVMLDQYIQRNGPPKNVIITHVYNVWPRQESISSMGKFLPWKFWNDFSPLMDPNINDYSQLIFEKYIPIYSENQTLREHLLGLRRSDRSETFRMDANGYTPDYISNIPRVEADLINLQKFVAENNFTLSSFNQKALEKMIQKAEEYGIQVYMVNSPLYEGLYNDPNFKRYMVQEQLQLLNIVDKSKNWHYITQIFTFPADEMTNVDHVVHPAAVIFTQKIIQEIIKLR